jgi:hypothetical protein
VRVVQSRGDRLGNVFRSPQHVIVPEAQNPEAAAGQPSIAPRILSIIGMLRAVRLDDQFRGQAGEIDDVGEDDLLPPKSVSRQAAAPQHGPEPFFGFGSMRPHPLGAFD